MLCAILAKDKFATNDPFRTMDFSPLGNRRGNENYEAISVGTQCPKRHQAASTSWLHWHLSQFTGTEPRKYTDVRYKAKTEVKA